MKEGRDIYEGNGDFTSDWFAQWDFVIIRAMSDYGNRDAAFDRNWLAAAGRTKRGAYGWPRHGVDNHALGRACAILARDAELGVWVDYEQPPGQQLATIEELEDWCSGARSVDPTVGFYSNLSELPRSPLLDQLPWWFANPSGNPAPRDVALTQYGVVDGLDADRCTDESFAMLLGHPTPPPPGDDEMLALIAGKGSDGVTYGFLCQGGRAITTWSGTDGAFGFPKGLVDYRAANPTIPVSLCDPHDVDRVQLP